VIDRFTFDRLRTTLLFLAIALAACLMPAQNDTWWHLRAGHDMWVSGHLLLNDTFSHTVRGVFWPNHEWLSQILIYGAYALGGLPLLTLASAAAVTGAWAIVWRETPAPPHTKFLITVPVIVTACTAWSPRPQVLSLLLVTVTLALLRRRRYGWLPPVFWLWANLHGAVVMGVLLLGAGLLAALVERPESLRRLVLCMALCLLAMCATPLGWHFWIEIVQSLARVRQLRIDEWAPPALAAPALLPFWLTIAVLIGLAATRGRALARDPAARREGHVTLCLCALAILPLALTAARNVPPFLMLAVPAVAALRPKAWDALTLRSAPHPGVNRAIAMTAAILVALAVPAAYASRLDRLQWTPLPASSLAALDMCRGNVYNRYDEGGYLIWFAPDHKVFLDGRQDPYPPALIKEQLRVESTGDFGQLFRRYDIGCTYLPADSLVGARLLRAGWTQLYRDARWAVLAH
jgi:hypothetical protein